MHDASKPYTPSAGALHGGGGVIALVAGAALVSQSLEGFVFVLVGVAFLGAGTYLLIAGAVARGVQLAAENGVGPRVEQPSSPEGERVVPGEPGAGRTGE